VIAAAILVDPWRPSHLATADQQNPDAQTTLLDILDQR
jgi:hypothetical protein